MAFINNYQYESYSKAFDVSDGDHAVSVTGAQVKQTSKGSQMLEILMSVPDANNAIYTERYVEGDYFNQNMSKFFDAFSIQPGNFNFQSWKGKQGKAHFIHKEETFTDSQGMLKTVNKCKMQYLIVPEKEIFQEDVPYQQSAPQMSGQDQKGFNAAFGGNPSGPDIF